MKRTMTTLLVLGLGICGLALPRGVHADAQPQFHHSGSMCQQVGSDGQRGWWNQGVISNESWSETMRVHCPVVRENDASEIGTMSVYLVDRNSGEGVRCSWYDVQDYGWDGRWWWSGWKTSLGQGDSNYGNLTWERNTVYGRYSGYSHLICDIPPTDSFGRSYVSQYRIGE